VNVELVAHHLLRYGLVLILFWIGAMKFTAFDAEAIKPLVETSPFMSWMYRIFDLQTVSNIFGMTEIAAGLMIALRPISPRLAAFGSTAAVLMFLTTLTFLLSLPGWEPALGGFPALSSTGGFLLKDIVLLGTALWSAGEALNALRPETTHSTVFTHKTQVFHGRP
jgi:reactive chlorine resistance protein C